MSVLIWKATLEIPTPAGFSLEADPVWPDDLPCIPNHVAYENPNGNSLIIEVYLENESDLRETNSIRKALEAWLGVEIEGFAFSEMEQKDWVRESEKALNEVEAGRFFIHGSHFKGEPPKGKIPILIDATLAFGTGYHETTRCCLHALDTLADQVSSEAALDLGCGSGILAFAMAKVWPKAKITATDMDDVAIRVAQENAAKNDIGNVTLAVADGFDHPALKGKTFDVITANILAGPLIDLAPEMADHLNENGTIVLSGLTLEQKENVLNIYEKQGLRLVQEFPENNWVALVLGRA